MQVTSFLSFLPLRLHTGCNALATETSARMSESGLGTAPSSAAVDMPFAQQ